MEHLYHIYIGCLIKSNLDIKFWFRRHQLLRWSLPVHILVLKISKSPAEDWTWTNCIVIKICYLLTINICIRDHHTILLTQKQYQIRTTTKSMIPSHQPVTHSPTVSWQKNKTKKQQGYLDTASDPFTLCIMTEPPAFWIRSFSGSFDGWKRFNFHF